MTENAVANVEVPNDTALNVIANAARDPNVDVSKMQALLDMQMSVMDREAEKEFNVAMVAAQLEMPIVVKDAVNPQTHSKYAKLEHLQKKIKPIIQKNGFALSFGTADCPLEKHCRVTCKISHIGGHSEDKFFDLPLDTHGIKGTQNKTGTHGAGSTVAYARRYLTAMIFDIVIADEDDDGNQTQQSGVITDAQAEELRKGVFDLGNNIEAFCNHVGVASIAEIRTDQLQFARNAIKSQQKNTGK